MSAKVQIDFNRLAESMRAQKLSPETAMVMLKTAFEQAASTEQGLCANPRLEHCGPHPKKLGCVGWAAQ